MNEKLIISAAVSVSKQIGMLVDRGSCKVGVFVVDMYCLAATVEQWKSMKVCDVD